MAAVICRAPALGSLWTGEECPLAVCSAGRQNRKLKKTNNYLSGFFRSVTKAPIRRLFGPLVGKSQESSVKYQLLSTPLGPVLLSLLSLETSWIAVSIITVILSNMQTDGSHIKDVISHSFL